MTNFILDKIQMRNVRCYGDEMMEMDFPLNNLTVFTGHVGAGKSTILKAVSMALYGEDGGAKNRKLSIDDMINEKNGKNLEIHLFFHSQVDQESKETKYEIHLFHKHKRYNNKLVFIKDGRDISLESKTSTYELIQKTLIPNNVYHNIYYFTQQATNFFTALSNSEQKEIFNAILDLSEYKGYYENVKKCIENVDIDLASQNSTLKSNSNNVIVFRNLHDNAYKHLEECKQNVKNKIEDLEEEMSNLQTDIDNLNSRIYDWKGEDDIKNLTIEIEKLKIDLQNKITSSQNDVSKIEKDFDSMIVPNLKDKYIKIRLEKVKDIDSKISDTNIKIEKCCSNLDSIKNTLKVEQINAEQNVRNDYQNQINKINDEIKDLTNNLNTLNKNYIECISNLKDDIQKKVDKIKEDNGHLNSKIENIKYRISNDSEKKDDLLRKIENYTEDLNEPDAVCSLCGQKLSNKDHLQKHIDDLKNQIAEIDKYAQENLLSLKKYESNVNDNTNEMKKLAEDFKNQKIKLQDDNTSQCNVLTDNRSNLEKTLSELKNKIDIEIKNIQDTFIKVLNEKIDPIQKTKELLETENTNYNNKKLLIDNNLREEYKNELLNLKTEKTSKIDSILQNINNVKLKLSDEINSKQKSLNVLNESKKQVDNIKNDIGSMEKRKFEIETEYKKITSDDYFEEQLSAIKKGQDWLNDAIQKTKESQKIVDNTTKKKQILEFWKTAFSDSGIKSMLIDAAIPHMNECVSKELERVAPGKFTVSFDTLSETKSGKIKDKFCINIINNDRGSTGHKKLSGGETRIVDLCCMTALRELAEKLYNKRFCHIFYDEILDSLDDECKQQFCANVKLQSQSNNVTLVTHDLPEDVDPDRTFPF